MGVKLRGFPVIPATSPAKKGSFPEGVFQSFLPKIPVLFLPSLRERELPASENYLDFMWHQKQFTRCKT